MEERSARSREAFNDTTYDMMGTDFHLYNNNSPRSKIWFQAFTNTSSIHNYETFIINCLPCVVKELQEFRGYKLKAEKRSKASELHQKLDRIGKLSLEVGKSPPRRSVRLKILNKKRL